MWVNDALEFYEENGRELYEGRKERREKNFSLYHSSHTFFIIDAYVTFKTFCFHSEFNLKLPPKTRFFRGFGLPPALFLLEFFCFHEECLYWFSICYQPPVFAFYSFSWFFQFVCHLVFYVRHEIFDDFFYPFLEIDE